jgi:hypothetical protein
MLWSWEFFKRTVAVSAAVWAVSAAVLAVTGRASWIAGAAGAWVWAVANQAFLVRIVRGVAQDAARAGRELRFLCLVKFPLLYLLGLGWLLLPFVKVAGVLVGLSAYWLVWPALLWARPKK